MLDPTVGRWLNEDPLGFGAGDANLFRYVGTAATRYTDPSGLIACADQLPTPNQGSGLGKALDERLEAIFGDLAFAAKRAKSHERREIKTIRGNTIVIDGHFMSRQEADAIADDIKRMHTSLEKAISDLKANLRGGENNPKLDEAVRKWFFDESQRSRIASQQGLVGGVGAAAFDKLPPAAPTPAELRAVKERLLAQLEKMKKYLESHDDKNPLIIFQYDIKNSKDAVAMHLGLSIPGLAEGYAFATSRNGRAVVLINRQKHWPLSHRVRIGVILHELSHHAISSRDHGYSQGYTIPLYRVPNKDEKTPWIRWTYLTPEQLLENADTLEGFLEDFYLP